MAKSLIFEFIHAEVANLKSHLATSSWSRRHKLLHAFTGHGAIIGATVRKSPCAFEVSAYAVCTFAQLRELPAGFHVPAGSRRVGIFDVTNCDLKHCTRRQPLCCGWTLKQESFEHITLVQFKQAFDAIRELMTPPPVPAKRPIGFDDSPAK